MAEQQTVATAAIDVVVQTDGIALGVQRAKAQMDGMAKSSQQAGEKITKEQERITKSLERQVAQLGLTRSEQIAYQIATKTTGAEQERLFRILHKTNDEVARNVKQFNAYGLSAKQVTAAMRGVPAQLTDIAVGLQMGQNPLTILLQQGGQLRDMFGGIRPAAAALGKQLLALINPYTLIAGAITAVAVAAYKGSREQAAYNTAIIQTGNYAATSAGQLQAQARAISAVTGTVGAAAETLSTVVGSGKIVSENISTVALTLQMAQKVSEEAFDSILKDFQKLQDDPLKAMRAINEQQHIFSLETYNAVKALQDQGRAQAAATLATQEYARETQARLQAVQGQLGWLERGWKSVTGAAKWAWDAMKDIGRSSDGLDNLRKQAEYIDTLRKSITKLRDAGAQEDQLGIFEGRLEVALAKYRTDMQAFNAQQTADRVASNRQILDEQLIAEKAAAEAWGTNAERREKALTRIRGQYEEMRRLAAGDADRLRQINELEKQAIANAERQFRDPKSSSGSKQRDATGILASLADRIALNREAVTSTDKLTASEQLAVRVRNDLNDKTKEFTAAERAAIEARLQELGITGKQLQQHEAEIKATEALTRLQAQLAAARENQVLSNQADLAVFGRGGDAAERLQRQVQIEQQYTREVAKLRSSAIAEGTKAWIDSMAELEKWRGDSLAEETNYWEQREAIMGNWATGANAAIEDFMASTRDIAGAARSVWGTFFDGLGDAVVNFTETSKLNFDSLTKNILAQMTKLATNQFLMALLGGGGGAQASGSGWMGALFGGLNTFAKGAAINSPGLSQYSNQVHTSPKMFAFAKGAGVFAEAGPEAIMPLSRDGRGRLGVAAMGGGGGNVEVNIIGAPSQPQVQQRTGQDGSKTIDVIFKQLEGQMAQRLATGQGPMGAAMRGRFGLREQT